MLDPYDVDGFYDTHRRVERELIEAPDDLVDLVSRAPHLRAIARDRSWVVLFMQPRLDAAGFARWVEDPRSAGGNSHAAIFVRDETGAVCESRRELSTGLRVAAIGQRRWRNWALELELHVAPAEAVRWGIGSGKTVLRLDVRTLGAGSLAEMLFAGGMRTREVRRAIQEETEAEQRREEEARAYREEAAALEAQRRLAHRMTVGRMARSAQTDPRFGDLGPLEDTFSEAAKTLSIDTEQASRLRRAAVLRVDLRPAEDDAAAAGRSQMGGTPELPEDFPWPHVEKGPMWLWLQLDLEAIPALPDAVLPTSGRLLVFVGTGDYPDAPEVRVEWFAEGPFRPRQHPPIIEDSEDFLWPPESAPLRASLGIELPSWWDYSLVGDALLEYRDHDLVKRLLDEFGHPAKLCILPHARDDHGASDEDGREPKRPEDWVPLLSTAEDGLWDPMCTALMIHRDDLAKRDLSRVRLYVFNAS